MVKPTQKSDQPSLVQLSTFRRAAQRKCSVAQDISLVFANDLKIKLLDFKLIFDI